MLYNNRRVVGVFLSVELIQDKRGKEEFREDGVREQNQFLKTKFFFQSHCGSCGIAQRGLTFQTGAGEL